MSESAPGVEVLAFLLCQRVIRDAAGAFSVLGVFNSITVPHVPGLLPEAAVFIDLKRGRNDTENFVLSFVSPNGANVRTGAIVGVQYGEHEGFTQAVDYGNLLLSQYGVYKLKLLAADRLLAERSLRVLPPAGTPQAGRQMI